MHSISLRQIEIFRAVMTTGNLTEAAALLQTSQPTVSRELARFEKLIRLQLFDRVRGRLSPTVQGLRLFEEVQRSYYGLDRIVNAAAGIRQFQQAQLSIVCLPVFSQSLLPAVCRPFIERYPEVSFSVIPQESPLLEEWLSAQRHDLGLTETTLTPAGTERVTLMTLNEVCVLPTGHPLLVKDRLTPQDFCRAELYQPVEHRQLSPPAGCVVRRTARRAPHGDGNAQRSVGVCHGEGGRGGVDRQPADGARLCR